MLQNYKLRLGDGTVLLVDRDGLSSWLGDRKALVQPVGSDLWKPLKGFLAQERSAARRAARHQPKPPSTSRDALPLVYPKPREEPASGPPKEPIPVRADGLPLIPPPPRPAPAPPATVVRPSLPKPPAPPVLRKPTPPVAPPPLVPPRPPEDRVVVRPSLPKTPPPPVLAIPPTPPAVPPTEPATSSKPPTLLPTPRDDRYKVTAPSVVRALVEAPAETTVVQPLAEEPASFSTESVPPLLPSDEDVGWMTLPKPLDDEAHALPAVSWRDPLETSSASERPLLSHWIDSLARRGWQATRFWLMSHAASAYGALLALWNGLARGDRSLPSFFSGEPPWRALDSERSAPLPPRPTVGVPLGAPSLAEKGRASLGVYRPRRSTADGLPILQLEPLDDEIILEPLDDERPTDVPPKLSKLV